MCPTDRQLLRLLEGVPASGVDREVRAHVRACEICLRRLAELRTICDLMNAWQPDVPESDIAGRIMAAATAPDPWQLRWRIRLAASVLLAVGMGVAIANVVPVTSREAEIASPSLDEVTHALGLDLLGGEAIGLATTLPGTEEPI